MDAHGKVHCDCDSTMCTSDQCQPTNNDQARDLIFEMFGVNEAVLNAALTEELEHSVSIAKKHMESSNIESHKVKYAPVLQQLLRDMHHFEGLQELEHGALTYAQIQPWCQCSCPRCSQCPFDVAAGPLQTRLHLWCDGCCDLICECCDKLEQSTIALMVPEAETSQYFH